MHRPGHCVSFVFSTLGVVPAVRYNAIPFVGST